MYNRQYLMSLVKWSPCSKLNRLCSTVQTGPSEYHHQISHLSLPDISPFLSDISPFLPDISPHWPDIWNMNFACNFSCLWILETERAMWGVTARLSYFLFPLSCCHCSDCSTHRSTGIEHFTTLSAPDQEMYIWLSSRFWWTVLLRVRVDVKPAK